MLCKLLFRSFLAVLAFLAASAQASESAVAQPVPNTARPRIGLVLGGGGARGAAHVGVLEELEKLRVPVDCVAGTSMGALVAGAFAAGLSPAQMREYLEKADWNDMFQDNPVHSEINLRNKALERRLLSGTETGVSEKGVAYQGGVVSGQKIKLFFNRLVNSDLGERMIEGLPLPLSIIATDIGSGEKVVFREGSLTQAMRASMSVPGLMAPVDYQGHKLVDGGLVDNLPVDEVRERCHADVVIAVNVGSPLMPAEEVGSLLSVSVQMINILTEQNVSRALASLSATDVLIRPDLTGITAGDFDKSKEAAGRGARAVERWAERLRTLSVSEQDYALWLKGITYARVQSPIIDEVNVVGLSRVNPAVVESQLRIKPGDRLDDVRLNQDMLRIYGDGWFESVDYSLSNIRNRNVLEVRPVEKHWGPDYLRLGLNLDSNLGRDSSYTLRAVYDKTWLNHLGGELLLGAEIGRSNALSADLYQPLDERQRYFVETGALYNTRNLGVYEGGKKIADYEIDRRSLTLGAGINLGLLGQLHGGWRRHWMDAQLATGVPAPDMPARARQTYDGHYLALDLDQTDRLYFPTAGWAAKIAWFDSPKLAYGKLEAEVRGAYAIGDYVLNARLNHTGSTRGVLPIYDAASLGGFLNLSGFAQEQLNGDEMTYAGIRAEKIIGRLPLGLRGDMRAGIALETARVVTPFTETQLKGRLFSSAIYLGGETPVGPLYLGYGRSSTGAGSFHLFIGTP